MKLLILLLTFLLSTASWGEPAARVIKVAPDVDIPLSVHGPQRQKLILWLPSEHGVVSAEPKIAQDLAKLGYEVWVADLFAARFLPIGSSNLHEIPAPDVAQLLYAATQHHRQVYLVSSGEGAALALQGARLYQQDKRAKPLAGAILLFPNLFAGTAEAGMEPQYLAVTQQTRLPIAILQGKLSPWYWQLDELKTRLQQGGSQVNVTALNGLRDRFYFREDASPPEHGAGLALAQTIHAQIRQLPKLKQPTR